MTSGRLIDFCVAEFGEDGEQIAAELMQGFPNKSLESAATLWNLWREALTRPEIAALLESRSPAGVLAELPSTPGGEEFSARLDTFLDVYGQRNESFSELSFPTWREDPRFPLFIIRRYMSTPEESSPEALHNAAAARRIERQGEVETRLASDPERLTAFRAMLGPAQERTVLIENHNYYIDQQGAVAVRVPCLAIGRRLVERGAIETPDDVFYLEEDDIREAAVDQEISLADRVALRRAERDRWLRVLPPATIGAGAITSNPFLDRFFGPMKDEPDAEGQVAGVGASAGVFRGTARLILTLDDVDRLEVGDVLVTYATAPPWTPLFAVAGAIVTDAGGMASHCAVVAREYGIPAVVGCRTATRLIPDGAIVTVDGTRGVVRIDGWRRPG